MDPIQELVALEAIRKLKYLYAHHLDMKDVDRLVALFAEDALCEFGSSYGVWRGAAEIRAGYQAEIDKVRGIDYPFMHTLSTPWIELTSQNTATGKWYLVEMLTESNSVKEPLRFTGVYTDEYRRIGGQWKISRTRLDFTWPVRDITRG